MRLSSFYLLIAAILFAMPATAQDSTSKADTRDTILQILYFNGNVGVVRGSDAMVPAIGMYLTPADVITIGKKSSVQISFNGQLIRHNGPAKLTVAGAIKRAAGEENRAVMTALRKLAELNDDEVGRSLTACVQKEPATPVVAAGNLAITTACETAAADTMPYERAYADRLVILEPRSTAVMRGALRFRWLDIGDTNGYVLTVADSRGNEVFRAETKDTSLVWEGAMLYPRSEYTWTLSCKRPEMASTSAWFHRLDDIAATELEANESRIRLELGSKNPALPLLLGALFTEKGCHGEAARFFTAAALRAGDEHFDSFMGFAGDAYRKSMNMPEDQAQLVNTVRRSLTAN